MVRQPKKDKSCLVPCIGLYADLTDGFLKRKSETIEHSKPAVVLVIACLRVISTVGALVVVTSPIQSTF